MSRGADTRTMTDVFISYKRRLRSRVEEIAGKLERLGLTVWFDAELEPGTTFSAEISHEVRNAHCVLVCWTNDAFPHGGDEHGWVVGEATIGRNRKALVATTLEPTDLDPPWNTVHCEDLTDWSPRLRGSKRSAWSRVIEAIGRHVGRPGLSELDAALSTGTIRALSSWLEEYPDDPFSYEVQEELERRRSKRKLKARPAPAEDGRQRALESEQIDQSAELTLAVERGLMETSIPDLKADEREWLERDLALSEDLSFEQQKLQDAVAVALGTPIHQDDSSTASLSPTADPLPGPVTDLVEGRDSPPGATLLACTVGLAASSGLGIVASLFGWTSTSGGAVLLPVVCPAVYGFSIATLSGRDLPKPTIVLATISAPIVTFGAGLNAMIAQLLMPTNIAIATVGSFVGAIVYLLILSGLGAYRPMPRWYFVAAPVFVATVVTAVSIPLALDVRNMSDAPLIILAWEAAFGLALVLAPRSRGR